MRDQIPPAPRRTPESIVEAFLAGELGGHTVDAIKRAANEIRVIEGSLGDARPFNKRDVLPGKIFTDCRGNIRKVVAIGPQYVTRPGQADDDCCQYVALQASYKSSAKTAHLYNTTRLTMSIWAKQEVSQEYLLENGLNDYDIKRKKFIAPKATE